MLLLGQTDNDKSELEGICGLQQQSKGCLLIYANSEADFTEWWPKILAGGAIVRTMRKKISVSFLLSCLCYEIPTLLIMLLQIKLLKHLKLGVVPTILRIYEISSSR